ncbi:MAG: hypothetical protein KIS68_01090, partial [Bauldia sp.]|nr:hypothetical protein [Bauldia sp.]
LIDGITTLPGSATSATTSSLAKALLDRPAAATAAIEAETFQVVREIILSFLLLVLRDRQVLVVG